MLFFQYLLLLSQIGNFFILESFFSPVLVLMMLLSEFLLVFLTKVLIFLNNLLNIISTLRELVNHVGNILSLVDLKERMLLMMVMVMVPGQSDSGDMPKKSHNAQLLHHLG